PPSASPPAARCRCSSSVRRIHNTPPPLPAPSATPPPRTSAGPASATPPHSLRASAGEEARQPRCWAASADGNHGARTGRRWRDQTPLPPGTRPVSASVRVGARRQTGAWAGHAATRLVASSPAPPRPDLAVKGDGATEEDNRDRRGRRSGGGRQVRHHRGLHRSPSPRHRPPPLFSHHPARRQRRLRLRQIRPGTGVVPPPSVCAKEGLGGKAGSRRKDWEGRQG
ncbi:Os09g0110500, partial [Oryza sativa Japonica Group]